MTLEMITKVDEDVRCMLPSLPYVPRGADTLRKVSHMRTRPTNGYRLNARLHDYTRCRQRCACCVR